MFGRKLSRMNRKRLLLSALPLVVLAVALWFVGKYQPKTVKIEGAGSQMALRALAKACEDYPLARQITVKRTRPDSLTQADWLIYDRREGTFWWHRPLILNEAWHFTNVGDADLQAAAKLSILPREDYDTRIFSLLIERGCLPPT